MSVWECIAILLSSTKVPLLPVWWDQEERRQSLTVARSKTEQYKCASVGKRLCASWFKILKVYVTFPMYYVPTAPPPRATRV